MVTCRDAKYSRSIVYSNVHVAITISNKQYVNMQKTKESFTANNTKPISLLIIGIDSISRLNFYRTMPTTKKFLDENDWIEYIGYNKMGENTFPNLMAMLTGKCPDYAYKQCDPTIRGKLETCPFIWKDFKNLGYVTAYGEDEDAISTFNYKKKGFVKNPTDFYFKTYMHGAAKLTTKIVDDMHYCTGPEQSGERILNLAKDFSKTFYGHPMFGLFWMNSFSHNSVNSPTRLDKKVASFFKDLKNDGILNEVMIIFVSDHGMRFGKVRQTTSGWIEERLPYLYFWVPPWLRQTRPKEYNNLRNNAKRLTSPYDMYMTIQDILVLSNFTYAPIQSDSCPMCQSLFKEIPEPRSCEETGISTHWCTCNGYVPIKTDNKLVGQSANITLQWIQSKIQELVPGTNKCASYTLAKIMSASLSADSINTNDNTTSTHILLMFETKPKAIFESTVTLTKSNVIDDNTSSRQTFKVLYVSRLDEYKPHSGCIEDARAKNYCYCKKH
nr:uncharacterized protein LOC111422529 [Onthophagus taurus]